MRGPALEFFIPALCMPLKIIIMMISFRKDRKRRGIGRRHAKEAK